MNANPSISYEQTLRDAYKARRARAAAAARNLKQVQVRPVLDTTEPVLDIRYEQQDAHVFAFHAHKLRALSPKRAFITDRAADFGLTFEEMTARGRVPHITWVRQLIMLEVKEKWPSTSLPEIGKLFGGYDHTTVIHALERAKEAREKGKERPHPSMGRSAIRRKGATA